MPPPRILFIDAYDSFSNSIIALLRSELHVYVETIKIDDSRFVLNDAAFFSYLDGFIAVVAGPGPGHPGSCKDVGLIGKLWSLPEEHLLPVLGVCLGFQSLCLASGAQVRRLKEPRHGIMAMISHSGQDIFTGARRVIATQYHSLHVQLEDGDSEIWQPTKLWSPSTKCPDLSPLAWDLMNVLNGPILMAVRHCRKPFWGVQYHPESICTNKEGQRLIGEWWKLAYNWRQPDRKPSLGLEPNGILHGLKDSRRSKMSSSLESLPGRSVQWSKVEPVPLPPVVRIMNMLKETSGTLDPLLLESGTRNGEPVNPETGRFSIIGMRSSSSMQLRYSTASKIMEISHDGEVVVQKQVDVQQVFTYVDDHMRSQKCIRGPTDSPFWGGFVGFISYEAGLESIDVAPEGAKAEHPDMWFIFVDRSLVVDHVNGLLYVQSIRPGDDLWINSIVSALKDAALVNLKSLSRASVDLTDGPVMDQYCRKVHTCQVQLRAGESYELCLTDQSRFRTQSAPWDLYCQLQRRNPAPFSAYLHMSYRHGPGIFIAGSSPERFLSWSREGKCQFRPIKGTVKKAPWVTRAKAEEILGSAKERAENLMIVDLIRHDLAGVAGITQVRVPKLMSVEEYETVFQLVSVIEGDLEDGASGTAALAASLPPGSMTGAPKKRSCELLKEIEGEQPRGLYSGVLGYFDVGGGGDFSVVIRTAFKWDNEGDSWRIGAGGAVTALSDVEAEWEEMITKRESVLNALS